MTVAAKRFAYVVGACLACLVAIAAAPAQAHAVVHPSADDIVLGGVVYSASHPETVSYDESSGVLTLEYYDGGGIQVFGQSDVESQLTIDLVGYNQISCTGEPDIDPGIRMTGGKGSIEITSSDRAYLELVANYTYSGIYPNLCGVMVDENLTVSGNADVWVWTASSSSDHVRGSGICCQDGGVIVKDHARLKVWVTLDWSNGCYGIESHSISTPALVATTDDEVSFECTTGHGANTFAVYQPGASVPLGLYGVPYVEVAAVYVATNNGMDGFNFGLPSYSFSATGPNAYVYKLETGWLKVGSKWRYYLGDGEFVTNDFRSDKNKTYYFDADGFMVTGWKKVAGAWYFFSRNGGAMQFGWVKDGGKWYYLSSGGTMATGWQKLGSTWYYFDVNSGAMKTGWQKISGKWYWFESSGAMKTGWLRSGGKWYYLQSSGAMATGWLKVGSTWYYFDSSGAMATGTRTINGKTYRFSSSGAWIA
ncbi:Autolysin [Slackia heliotrinireducens]|uniref:Putative cell wall binding protein n=1 Tax=Slackia heliotrinireducens (strain ATCC 29202 / DSM 20476 / NCTC 11029 / RHS 1) TaxID=471855 RepID=C7N0T4_SLAHD|nr:N-acetylmuramoyl-L-alanine amidase family protein [Slackia heliotrinireducens]ACV21162.1 putative cell wall binding protein [Slackia heliotrinireducens DSM 20476]VEG98597.1 Autolysin [Slackia heliotrinireducens]